MDIVNKQIIKDSPAFAAQLIRALRSPSDEQTYFRELTRLARQQLGWQVAKRRKQKKWSQAVLAKKLGTTQAVLSRIERGRVNVEIDLMVRLKAMLGISVLE